jgi:hypothetical protein
VWDKTASSEAIGRKWRAEYLRITRACGTYRPYLTWLQVVKLYYQGWDKLRISCFLQVSRSTVDTWIARFEAEHFAGLMNTKRGHKEPPPHNV